MEVLGAQSPLLMRQFLTVSPRFVLTSVVSFQWRAGQFMRQHSEQRVDRAERGLFAQAVKAQGPLEAPAAAAAAEAAAAAAAQGSGGAAGSRSLLYHMRGNARANAADLLHNWLQDFQASGVRHTPQSLTALVQVKPLRSLVCHLVAL